MEADFVTNGMLIEDAFEADDNANNINSTDNFANEGERCGICMDIVIDRGVLDCCQHWFCFACIDNWATITSLCPLCQNEFQLITCVPVYDTIGSNKVEDDSFSRDDDWSIEGKSNTLSFPSYYIDENAVICLDGDGCKIRSGSATTEGDSSLDTSIACDSCDIWYHAFCVGFDPEGTSDTTWLCPRCVLDEVLERMDTSLLERTTTECNPENGNNECQTEESFSGKVSVSVADTGETAVVVSLVEGNQWTPPSSEKNLLPPEVNKDPMTESCVSISDTNNHQRKTEETIILPIVEEQELELSLSHNVFCNIPSNSLGPDDLKKSAYGERSEPGSFSKPKILNESPNRTSPSRNESDMGLHLGLSVGSFLSVDDMDMNATKDQGTDILQLSPGEFELKGYEKPNAHKDNARVMGGKRKHIDNSDQVHVKAYDRDAKLELGVEVSQKKLREDGSQLINHKDSADAPLSDNTKNIPSIPAFSRDDDLKHCPTKENATSDIMSIVKGTNQRISKGLAGTKPCNKLTKTKENMAGLRVKKIMKRAPDQGESSLVVQNLREEIREAVRNKSSKIFGENLFDAKLLAAFRAAIAGPAIEPVNKLSPIAVKAKKSMLQKGKVREHLTKKIFGTSNGRRKRAWDRDCEIEFWKYRCMRATKPEKIATLKSVLDLLRETSESPELKEGPECQAKNPILSRLYLADTSVFPRKNDVKPLSVLKTAANSEQSKQHNPSGKVSNLSLDGSTIKATEINNVLPKARFCSSENKVSKKLVHGSVGDNSASRKVPLSRHSKGTSISCSGGSKVDSKELGVKSDCIKSDKRKWALEVLARKTAAAGKKTNDNQEDNANIKGNYPLLAQLPADMRPVLAPSHHNKIPISVRQTQLYRLTEHFLRNTNLSVIRRTAVTELAVADAINIEKEVADRSNSKLVYLNLCSQELLHRSNNRKSNGVTDSIPPVSSADLTDRSEQNTDDFSTDPAVEIALKNAGLLSDSPPSSPHEKREISNKEDDMSGPDNILELDSHPEMDIYGDFEYDLEDEDYIGASVAEVSNPQEEERELKMKLIFSTMNLKNSDTALDCVDCERSANNEVPRDPSCSSNHYDAGNRDSAIDAEIGKPSVPSDTLLGEGAVEPFDADFEELYGPDKEPLIKKFPDEESRILHGEGNTGTITKGNECRKEQVSDHVVNTSSEFRNENLAANVLVTAIADNLSNISESSEDVRRKEERSDTAAEQSDSANHVSRKVEVYVKEHIRPLCKSGVITAEQYRWAVAKTTEKVMKYHSKAKNANFLIKEGEKVKKLAEQYVEAAQQNKKK